jgi:hypothetical protein
VLNANTHTDRKASVIFPYFMNMSAKQTLHETVVAANKQSDITKTLHPYHLQSLHLQNHPQIHHHSYFQSFHLPNHHLLLQSCQEWNSKTTQCSDVACVLYPATKINIHFQALCTYSGRDLAPKGLTIFYAYSEALNPCQIYNFISNYPCPLISFI